MADEEFSFSSYRFKHFIDSSIRLLASQFIFTQNQRRCSRFLAEKPMASVTWQMLSFSINEYCSRGLRIHIRAIFYYHRIRHIQLSNKRSN